MAATSVVAREPPARFPPQREGFPDPSPLRGEGSLGRRTLTLMLAAALLAPPPVVWYGPKTVSFNLETSGNPYDPVKNDVEVEFRGPDGVVEKRLAYFDDGEWKATLLAREKGAFTPVVFTNGARGVNLPPVTLTTKGPHGFVRLGSSKEFRLDDGTPYWPLGYNLAWTNKEVPDLPAELRRMGTDGLNWARIWADHWDGKNPFWKEGETPKQAGTMIPSVLAKWDAIVDAADGAGVWFQMTMFHHGPWSTHTDSNWKENPWNAASGGFLKTPDEFFTNARAKALAKEWLRYAVARWGHSPGIMAWELFNEAQWVDAIVDKKADTVGAWHDEMADYVRSIDPYHHLITTSSDLDLPIYRRADYLQPHTYPPSVEGAVSALPKLDKPGFFGEFGPNATDRAAQVAAIRDGIWTSFLSLQAGSAQYWYWDRVAAMKLQPEFIRAANLLREIGPDHEGFVRRDAALGAGVGGDFAGQPGMGWGTSTQFAFNLPEDAPDLGRLSGFLQGRAHREMQKEPVTFRFTLPKAATVSIEVTGASDSGGNLVATVDGRPAGRREFGPKAKGSTLSFDLPAGAHTVTLGNDGPDWVTLGRIAIPGIAPRATARAVSDGKRAVLRVRGEKGVSVSLDGLGLKDGRYRMHLADLEGGDATGQIVVKGGRGGQVTLPGADTVIVIR